MIIRSKNLKKGIILKEGERALKFVKIPPKAMKSFGREKLVEEQYYYEALSKFGEYIAANNLNKNPNTRTYLDFGISQIYDDLYYVAGW